MLARFAATALAVIVIPAAIVGAQPPAAPDTAKKETERRTCEVSGVIGSRLGGVRRCRTKSERKAHQQEARQVVDRIQHWKPLVCDGAGGVTRQC